MLKILSMTALTLGIASCNANALLTTEKQKKAIDQLLAEAQYDYDKGDFDGALEKAEEALAIDENYEATNVQLSYIFLAKSGIDIFNFAKKIVDQEKSEGSDKASQLFTTLSAVVGIDSTELSYLTTDQTRSLAGVDVNLPKSADEARSSQSEVVTNINRALSYLCPFVNDEAKLLGEGESSLSDERHSDCEATGEPRAQSGSANFAWGLGHLGEALAFYSVLFFQEDGQTDSNLERGVAGLSQINNPTEYAQQITALDDTIDAIFPTDPQASANSMLNAMFNNLEATNRGFGAAGAPDGFTKSISKAIEDIKSKAEQLNSSVANSKALKSKLTKGLSKKLSQQIEEQSASASDEEIAEMCEAFENINEGAAQPPSACN